jgi:hypothetical protein
VRRKIPQGRREEKCQKERRGMINREEGRRRETKQTYQNKKYPK